MFSWASDHKRLLLFPNKVLNTIYTTHYLHYLTVHHQGTLSVVFANHYQFGLLGLHTDYWFAIYTCSKLPETPVLSFVSITSFSVWTLAVTSGHISYGEWVIKRTGSHDSSRKMETFHVHYWWACLASINENRDFSLLMIYSFNLKFQWELWELVFPNTSSGALSIFEAGRLPVLLQCHQPHAEFSNPFGPALQPLDSVPDLQPHCQSPAKPPEGFHLHCQPPAWPPASFSLCYWPS